MHPSLLCKLVFHQGPLHSGNSERRSRLYNKAEIFKRFAEILRGTRVALFVHQDFLPLKLELCPLAGITNKMKKSLTFVVLKDSRNNLLPQPLVEILQPTGRGADRSLNHKLQALYGRACNDRRHPLLSRWGSSPHFLPDVLNQSVHEINRIRRQWGRRGELDLPTRHDFKKLSYLIRDFVSLIWT